MKIRSRLALVVAGTVGTTVALGTVSAQAATYEPISVKDMKAIVSLQGLAPSALGDDVKPNLTTVTRKAPGDVYCWNADGTPRVLPDGATMVTRGWSYNYKGDNNVVGTTIYQYPTAAKAKAAAKALATASCPNDAAYTEDEGAPPVKTQQSTDQWTKRHGQRGFLSSNTMKDGRTYVTYSAYRPVGNAVIVASGMDRLSQVDELAAWAKAAANSAADAYAAEAAG